MKCNVFKIARGWSKLIRVLSVYKQCLSNDGGVLAVNTEDKNIPWKLRL